ncbi:MAG TPA: dihydrolipoyllysine-residue acetyltransferase [Solirubrobacteraceae bacterium]|nr:dihydrolipoyllysine-residue acetyltransferase [Solirubrobacteraceae bacterium]
MSATSSGKVAVPDIGDFSDVPIIEILVSEGDTVSAEDPLVTLESDKATMDVPAPFGGVVRSISVKVGDTVSEGSELMVIESSDGDSGGGEEAELAAAADRASTQTTQPAEAAAEPASEAEPAAEPARAKAESETGAGARPAPESPAEPAARAATNGGDPGAGGPIYASPSVRRLARELGVDLRGATGSGRKGRITPDDVRGLASGAQPGADGAVGPSVPAGGAGLDLLPWPQVDFEKFGPVERVARSRIQRISAPNLARNWVMIPHVTHNDEADITELEAWRKELNADYQGEVKFTMVSFLVKASVVALKRFPDVNASLDTPFGAQGGEQLVRKLYYNIGFAADTPNGLVVPVIKDADRKGLAEIASDLTELSGRARAGKLGPSDMSGATFTISSLGGIGGTSFSPIINAPEVAILGVTRAAMKPVWNGGEFVPRLILPLSFSYDHRVIDGAAAARFTAFLARVLSDLRRALL